MKSIIEEVFQCKVYDRYGLGEEVATAIECESHSGYHVDMDKCIVQIVDENNDEIWNKSGRVIGTNLNNYAMPLIRYDTGDVASIKREACKCGREMPRLYDLNGRSSDVLIFPSGKRMVPTHIDQLLLSYPDISEKFVEFQIKQFSPTHIQINIVPKLGVPLRDDDERYILDMFYSFFQKMD